MNKELTQQIVHHIFCGLGIAPNSFFKNSKFESIKSKIKFDKKSINNKVNWSLPVAIGKAFYDQHIPDKIVEDSIIVFLENYKKKHVKQI